MGKNKFRRFYLKENWYSFPTFQRACNACNYLDLKWITLTDYCVKDERKDNPLYQEFMKGLKPLCLSSFSQPKQWYGTFSQSSIIYLLPYCDEVFNYLSHYTIDLLMMDCIMAGRTLIPHDINIFRGNGDLFLGTVSHEKIADIFIREDETISTEKYEKLYFNLKKSNHFIVSSSFEEGVLIWSPTNLFDFLPSLA